MKKSALGFMVIGIAVMVTGMAYGGVLNINFDTEMTTIRAFTWEGAQPFADYASPTADNNANTMLDSDEFALLSSILANTSALNHDAIHTVFTANVARVNTDLGLAGAILPQLKNYMAAYCTVGDDDSWQFWADACLAITDTLGTGVTPIRSNYQSAAQYIAACSDYDGDTASNLGEYNGQVQVRANYVPAVQNVQVATNGGDPSGVCGPTGPKADFHAVPVSAVLPDTTIAFTDDSNNGGATITAWAWTFGDGGTSTLQNPTHTYATAGLFTVALTITTNAPATDDETKTNYIEILADPRCPYAGVFNDPQTGEGPLLAASVSNLSVELAGLLAQLGMNTWQTFDIEKLEKIIAQQMLPPPGDGLPDEVQMAVLEYILCHDAYWAHAGVLDQFETNLALFDADVAALGQISSDLLLLLAVRNLFSGMIGTSADMRDTINGLVLVLTSGYTGLPNYSNYKVFNGWSKTPGEILSGAGDLDGDGLTNKQEYDQVVAAGGDMAAIVLAITNPSNLWPGNPGMPVGGLIGLTVLAAALAAGARSVMKKK